MKKVTSTIKSFIKNNKLFLVFVIFSILVEITLRIRTIGFHLHYKAFLSDCLIILLIGSISFFLKSKTRYRYFLIWLFLGVGLSVGNTIYYDFYQSYISINLIGTASMVGQVNDALWAKIHLDQFIYLIYFVLFIVIYKLFNKHSSIEEYDHNKAKKYCFRSLAVAFVLLVFLGLSMSKLDRSKFSKLFNKASIVQKYGLYVYTVDDLIQSAGSKINDTFGYDESSLAFRNYYSCKKESASNEYTNIFKGKNVIFIHMESIQNFLVDLKINNELVIPNISRIAHEGIYFDKFYPQISVGTSSDTEFTLTTGLMPSSSGTVFVNYYDRLYYGMPSYFKDMGYYTFSTHANIGEYWNREKMHKTLGYMDFYDKDSYIVPEDSESPDLVGLGLSDKAFFNQFVSILKTIKSNHSKYFGTVITLSNHLPFNDIEKYGEFDVSAGEYPYLEGSMMGNYLKSSHYADEALGEFFELLKKEGLYKDTVFILYGDHEARLDRKEFDLLYNYDSKTGKIKDSSEEDYYDLYSYNYDLLRNTPLIIWSEEAINTKISSVMGMYDVLPTIANMFGFKDKYSLGHDIFSDNEKIVVFPNGNVLTDKVYYSDLYEEYVSLSDEPIDTNYIDRIREYANNILDVSNGIVTHDLIRNESKNIGVCKK